MSRILIALELGANYGHLAACLPIAQALQRRGHSVVFSLRDVRTGAELLHAERFEFIQTPVLQKRPRLARPPANFAEILLGEGYGDKWGLVGLVAAWRNVLDLVGPDVVLADHAPTALLAAHLAGVPHVAIGTGFTLPPDLDVTPSIRPWEAVPEHRLQRASALVNEMIAHVTETQGYRSPICLRDLYGPTDLLATFRDLDVYERDRGNYIGPIFSLPDLPTVAWRPSSKRRIVAYLRPEILALGELMKAFGKLDADVVCVIPGLARDVARRFAGPRLRIAVRPVSMAPLLETADAFVGYGGHGIVCQTLTSGVPMVIIPGLVEQYLNARRVEALGTAIVVGVERRRENLEAALHDVLENGDLRRQATSMATRYRDFTVERSVDQAVETLERAIRRDRHVPQFMNA